MFRYKPFALLVASVAFPAAVEACETQKESPRESAPASVESVAKAIGLDASELATVDPAPPAGDLASESAHFTSLEACIKEHAALDPLVGDAIRSIGYETFLRDACRLLEAMKAKDRAKCAPIDASSLRERCETYVAIAAANADACPWVVPSDASRGREPGCVAAAARDPRLCVAEDRGRRAACEALVSRDEAPCKALGDVAGGECRREALRWRGVLDDAPKRDPLPEARGHLELHGADGTPNPPRAATDLREDVAHGVVLVEDAFGDHVEIGGARQLGATLIAPGPNAPIRFTLRVSVAKDAPTDARIDHLELDVPGNAELVCPGVRCDVRVAIKKLDRQRGGPVEVLVDGTLGVAPQAFKVHAEIATFTRDVVRQGPKHP